MWTLTAQGKYEDAENHFRRAIEVTEATLGQDHPQYSAFMGNLAEMLKAQVRATVFGWTLGVYLARIYVLPPCRSIYPA